MGVIQRSCGHCPCYLCFFTVFPQIVDFADKISFYVMGCVSFFKSSRDDIKANAALFTGKVTELRVLLPKFRFPSFVFVTQSLCLIFLGFILGNLPKERRNEISKDHVCGGKILFSSIMSLCLLVSSAGRVKACSAGTLCAEFPSVFFLIE